MGRFDVILRPSWGKRAMELLPVSHCLCKFLNLEMTKSQIFIGWESQILNYHENFSSHVPRKENFIKGYFVLVKFGHRPIGFNGLSILYRDLCGCKTRTI